MVPSTLVTLHDDSPIVRAADARIIL